MSPARSRAAVIIPARLGSRRFPRKVLAKTTGKYLIQHVYEGVVGTSGVDKVIVATDSPEVEQAVRSFEGDVRMTSPEHISGTDRVAEVATGLDEEIIINVQGDEPLVSRDDLSRLVEALRAGEEGKSPPAMATLARKRTDEEGFHDPNIVKVVLDRMGRALYFSRSSVPHFRVLTESASSESAPERQWLEHVGIYAFQRDFLRVFTGLPPGDLEKRERLEQLRALENGATIEVLLTENRYAGVDTEEEYSQFVEHYRGGNVAR